MKIAEITPRTRKVHGIFKVVEKVEQREFTSRKTGIHHEVAEFKIGDESGIILLTLWDERIENIEVGKTYNIKDAYINLFKGHVRLNLGRYGQLEEIDEDVEVDSENNISDKSHGRPQRRDQGFAFGSVY